MQPPFPFDTMLVFGFLSAMLLAGVFLRAKIGLFQRYLLPGCLIGGLIGLILVNTGIFGISTSILETFAYHFFNISFISVGLTGEGSANGQGKKGLERLKGPAWMALVQGMTFPLQAVVGGLVVLLFGLLGFELYPTFGFLAPLGFNEGAGQALSIGKVWAESGFQNGVTIGLTFAAIGFFFSFLIGIPLVNWGIRKGYSTFAPLKLPGDFMAGIVDKTKEKEPAGLLTFYSSNIDSMTFQAAMVGLVYLITYGLVKSLGSLLSPEEAKIIWGFFFFFGLFVALLVKFVMNRIGVGHVLDQGVQRRITGWSVDFLILSALAGIQIGVVWKYILPISLIAVLCGFFTLAVVLFLGRRLWSYNLERMAAILGTVTGTVPCGLLLLRILDPELKSPVIVELAVMNLFALPVIGFCTYMVNAPLLLGWSVGLTVLFFALIMGVSLALIKLLRMLGRPKF